MLTLSAGQAECLWDEALPVEVRELPEDLAARWSAALGSGLLGPVVERFRREVSEAGGGVDGWSSDDRDGDVHSVDGAQGALSVGVSDAGGGGLGFDSLAAVLPDLACGSGCRTSRRSASLTRRIGPETVSELTRTLIASATREKRFRPRAVRIDSTVIEADVKYPTDCGVGLAWGACARAGGSQARRGADRRSRTAGAGSLTGDGPHGCGRSRARSGARSGEAKARGAEADRADRRAVGALGRGGQTAGGDRAPAGAWPRREARS